MDEQHVYWHPPRSGVWGPLWWFARIVLTPSLPALVGFRVAGRRRIPARGGVLVVSNHLADLDPLFVGVACMPRRAQYLALAKHFTGRPLATILLALGAFPLRHGTPDTRALRYAREQLEAGRLVIIFPEGGPSWGAGLGEFRQGAGHLGLADGVSVVPAAVWGADRVLRGWRPVGRGPVRVAFGHPLEIPREGSRRARADELTRRARAAVQELLEPMMAADR